MKAVRLLEFGGQLVFNDVPTPASARDEILVKVRSTGVNHLDLVEASGTLRQILPIELPWIPGHEFSGVVEQVGSDVATYAPGDAVFGTTTGMGAYAEYLAVKAAAIARKPSNLSFEEAASVPVASQTAWEGIFNHGHLKKGQTILIHGGAGAVGAYAVQLASHAGATVLVTASVGDEAYLKSLGASRVIDYRETQFEKVLGEKVDVVFDLVGGDVQTRSFLVLKEGGPLVSAVQPVSQEETAMHRVSGVMMSSHRQVSDSAESGDCWRRGRYDQTSPPYTRSKMWPKPGRTSSRSCQRFTECRPLSREQQDASHTARSCFVWPRTNIRAGDSMLRIAIIIGSTRPGRNGEAVGKWVYDIVRKRTDAEFELVDIAEFNLPLLDEPMPPAFGSYSHDHTRVWSAKIASFDGYVFVTPEYNHGTSAALKNAIDFLNREWANKAAGFVAYGATMGARAVESLRLVMAELQVATVRAQVGLSLFTDFENFRVFKPAEIQVKHVNDMLDQLIAWTGALKPLRNKAVV